MTDQQTKITLKMIPVSYPEELVGMINQGYAYPLAPDKVKDGLVNSDLCQNCGGIGSVFVFVKKAGATPKMSPPMNEKSKWIEADVSGEKYSGWIAGEIKEGECPACSSGSTRAWLEKRCGLSGPDLQKSLASFSTANELADKKPAYDKACSILAMNGEARGFVTFYGSYGCGKTHLLKSIVNGLRGVGLWSLYATLNNLLTDIRSRFGEPNGQREVSNVIEFYRSIRVLCLDEIDKVNLTSWSQETIFALLDDRYNRKDNVLTVLASNTAPKDLPAELGYLSSRMSGGDVVFVAGPDMRPAIREVEDYTDK